MLFKKKSAPAPSVCPSCGDEVEVFLAAPPPDRIRRAILEEAIRQGVRDVLMESSPNGLLVFYRDIESQIWKEQMLIPADMPPGIIASFREAAGVNVAGRAGLDVGLILFEHKGVEYDVYVAILPIRHGNRIAMRLCSEAGGAQINVAELLQMSR